MADYVLHGTSRAPMGSFGICRIADTNHYVMIVEGAQEGRNAFLSLAEARISETNLPVLIIPNVLLRPTVRTESVVFGDAATRYGSIRFVDGTAALVAAHGDWVMYVDIKSGETRRAHALESPQATRWELVRTDANGNEEILLSHPSPQA